MAVGGGAAGLWAGAGAVTLTAFADAAAPDGQLGGGGGVVRVGQEAVGEAVAVVVGIVAADFGAEVAADGVARLVYAGELGVAVRAGVVAVVVVWRAAGGAG